MNRHFATRRMAHVLGFAGLIPFVVFSLGGWLAPATLASRAMTAQLTYAVAILSFLGGIHWGAALLCADLPLDRGRHALLWGITPSLLGVGAVQLPPVFAFALLVAAFLTVYLVDKRLYPWYRMPDWLPALRFKLTCVVASALALSLAAINFRS